jgi:hypothetical protein
MRDVECTKLSLLKKTDGEEKNLCEENRREKILESRANPRKVMAPKF